MTACELAVRIIGAKSGKSCPALKFNGEEAVCGLQKHAAKIDENFGKEMADVLGFGAGCCTTATVISGKTGEVLKFEEQPMRTKIYIVKTVRSGDFGKADVSGVAKWLVDALGKEISETIRGNGYAEDKN